MLPDWSDLIKVDSQAVAEPAVLPDHEEGSTKPAAKEEQRGPSALFKKAAAKRTIDKEICKESSRDSSNKGDASAGADKGNCCSLALLEHGEMRLRVV